MKIESCLTQTFCRLMLTALPVACLATVLCLADCVAEEAAKAEIPAWAKVSKEQIAAAQKLGIPVAFANRVGVKLVLVPSGEFLMGSAEDEVGR